MKFKKDTPKIYFECLDDFYAQFFLDMFNASEFVVKSDKVNKARDLILKFMTEGVEKGIFEIEERNYREYRGK